MPHTCSRPKPRVCQDGAPIEWCRLRGAEGSDCVTTGAPKARMPQRLVLCFRKSPYCRETGKQVPRSPTPSSMGPQSARFGMTGKENFGNTTPNGSRPRLSSLSGETRSSIPGAHRISISGAAIQSRRPSGYNSRRDQRALGPARNHGSIPYRREDTWRDLPPSARRRPEFFCGSRDALCGRRSHCCLLLLGSRCSVLLSTLHTFRVDGASGYRGVAGLQNWGDGQIRAVPQISLLPGNRKAGPSLAYPIFDGAAKRSLRDDR